MNAPSTSPFEGRRVLVTGGGGFIGRHLLARLAAVPGCHADATTRSSETDSAAQPDAAARRDAAGRRDAAAQPDAAAGPDNAAGVKAARWWTVDLTDPAATEALVQQVRPDLIVHLAGFVSGARELDAVMPALRSNLLATVNVLTAASRSGTGRVVLAGSMEEPRADEAGAAAPGSPYAASKWAASGYARMFHALYGLPVVVLRIFMTYGPAQRDPTKLIPCIIRSALRGEAPALASGARAVDWIYVEDVVEAIEAACGAAEAVGKSLDVGSGALVTIRDVALRLTAMIDPAVSPRFGALPDRPLERPQAADTAATRAAIGWSPRTSLEDGLARTVAWYRDQDRDHEGAASRPA